MPFKTFYTSNPLWGLKVGRLNKVKDRLRESVFISGFGTFSPAKFKPAKAFKEAVQ